MSGIQALKSKGGVSTLLKHHQNGVLCLTLNRPERRNALTPELMEALLLACREAAEDSTVRSVVLRGAGEAFCVGGDMSGDNQAPALREDRVRWLREVTDAARLLHEMPKPTIASIRGAVAGGALSLVAACDFRIVATDARFTTAFARMAFPGDYGGSYFLARLLGGAKARELYLLGDRIDAHEAQRIGLVTRLVNPDHLDTVTEAFAQRLAQGPTSAYAAMKRNLNLGLNGGIAEVLDAEAEAQVDAAATADHREAVRAFLEKREPLFHR